MNRLGTHTPFFANRFSINISDLKAGMIVDFRYTKTSVGKPETKRYTVMIVDPSYKRSQDKEPFTHAINLDIASRNDILSIARTTGATMANSTLEARMVYADKLLVEGAPREFYQSSIANLITGQGKGSYRTFKTSKLQSIQLIDYTFPDSIDYIEL
jgi:hypothetical protein|tara:strand:+ start:4330 stop:4800 length:471 start_codon:yes stop_codon:yes gene_type:complete